MKVLSVRQPYAALISSGAKLVENRTWRTSYRGTLLIHAGASGRSRAAADAYFVRQRYLVRLDEPLAYGAIVAACELADCLDYADAMRLPFAEGPVCWVLKDVRRLKPHPCKGALSLWNPPAGFRLTLADGGSP